MGLNRLDSCLPSSMACDIIYPYTRIHQHSSLWFRTNHGPDTMPTLQRAWGGARTAPDILARLPDSAPRRVKLCATPPLSFPSDSSRKQPGRFWQIVHKDKEFIQNGMHWAGKIGLPDLAKKVEDILLLKNWEDPSAVPEPPVPWPRPYYPELSGRDLLAADVKSLKEYIDYIRGSFKVWRVPLQEVYDPEVVASYFNHRPHVLAFRILEVFVAFASAIIKTKSEKAFKLNRSSLNTDGDEIQYEYLIGKMLKEAMLKLGPTFVKIGQSLSTRPDIIGPEICKVLAELQDELPPFPTQLARHIIEEELGHSVDEVFSFLSEEPVAAASFGQVYRGCTIEGQDVAVKVQRPNALYSVARDMYILRLGLGILQKVARRKSDLRLYVDELGKGLFGELDYMHEAARASEFQAAHSSLPFISVPKTLTHLTRKRVLTMEWMVGDKPKELLFISRGLNPGGHIYSNQQRLEARNRLLNLVNRGVEASLVQLLDTGLLHADPHPGNLLYTSTGQIGFLDFGLLCRMEKKHQFAMLASIVHIINGDWPSLVDDLAEMDIIRPETDLTQVRMDLQDALGNAVAKDRLPDIKFSKVLGKIWSIALKYHFKMPPYYTLVLRSVASLEGLALAADPDFRTFQAAYPYVISRLLTDNSAPMQKILHSLVLTESREFQWPKLALFIKLGERHFMKRVALMSGDENHTTTDSAASTQGGRTDLAKMVMKLLSSKDGAVLRRLLLTAGYLVRSAYGFQAWRKCTKPLVTTFALQRQSKDTSSVALAFVSTDATMFRQCLVSIISDTLYEWGSRILREHMDGYLHGHKSVPHTRQTVRMESTDASSLHSYKGFWRDRRLKILLYTLLKRLIKAPLLMLRVCWTCSLICCSALALAFHRLVVDFCDLYVQPISVVEQRRFSYQTVV